MRLIRTAVVGAGGQGAIDFDSIPETFTDLVLLCSLRGNANQIYDQMKITFNGSSSGYLRTDLYGDGTTAGVSFQATDAFFMASAGNGATSTANTFSNDMVTIFNYRSNLNKRIMSDSVGENNANSAFAVIYSGGWNNSAPITSISIAPRTGTLWVENSKISLYGIRKGSDGVTTTTP